MTTTVVAVPKASPLVVSSEIPATPVHVIFGLDLSVWLTHEQASTLCFQLLDTVPALQLVEFMSAAGKAAQEVPQ